MADEIKPPVFPVAGDLERTKVGDEVPTETREVDAQVNNEPVAAQKQGGPVERVEEVPVYEVAVTTDERVDYVIVPPEGRGDATLPIHAFVGAKTVEEIFAAEAADNQDDKLSDEDRLAANKTGQTPRPSDDKS
jgi:hypothetical protein